MHPVIFDMDGILIDSEPLWQQAELAIFGSVGVPLTPDMFEATTGMRMDAAVNHWFRRYPWTGVTQEEIASRIKLRVQELVRRQGEPIEGAVELARALVAAGATLAVCSSSAPFLIESVCEQLGIRSLFTVLQSAEGCVHGKPHPEPYLTTAAKLGVDPSECVVMEDSIIGMTAAAAAGMTVIGKPAANQASRAAQVCAIVCAKLTELSVPQILALPRRTSPGSRIHDGAQQQRRW